MIASRGSVMKGSPSADDVIKGFADYFGRIHSFLSHLSVYGNEVRYAL